MKAERIIDKFKNPFRIGKTEVTFHWSVLIIAVLIILRSAKQFPDDLIKGLFVGITTSAIVYSLVLIHEIAHIKAAEWLGHKDETHMVIWALGGAAFIPILADQDIEPKDEFVIAIAGPLSNLIMAILILIPYYFWGQHEMLAFEPTRMLTSNFPGESFYIPKLLNLFFWYNIILCVFNLIPALPMDGGRALRSFLSVFLNFRLATKISVFVAWAFAAAFIIGGFWIDNFTLILIGGLVIYASWHELKRTND